MAFTRKSSKKRDKRGGQNLKNTRTNLVRAETLAAAMLKLPLWEQEVREAARYKQEASLASFS